MSLSEQYLWLRLQRGPAADIGEAKGRGGRTQRGGKNWEITSIELPGGTRGFKWNSVTDIVGKVTNFSHGVGINQICPAKVEHPRKC